MKADILRPQDAGGPRDEATGGWVIVQDPDSGTIKRVWQSPVDDPSTPDVDESQELESFSCIVRGIINGGLRSVGTTEKFGDLYQAFDTVQIHFPASVVLTPRDRVTNIRGPKGVIWKEEQRPDGAATVFSVNGVTPVVDPFGQHIENYALLERAENQ
jgi:hypothetical protein